jgi:hypothetical protein
MLLKGNLIAAIDEVLDFIQRLGHRISEDGRGMLSELVLRGLILTLS